MERFVLDDGWFLGRRDDTAGLGDWWVDESVWPQGLGGLVDHVHGLGMQFGLWFEPEMVNPDSNLYREHPDWILSAEGRVPLQHRNQLVLDLTNPDVWHYLRDRVDAVLTDHAIDYVKWDHNRDLLEAGSAAHGGAPAAHAQNHAYYALLDDLRDRHPARRLGVLRRRWWTDRPRRHRAGAAVLDLGHDRRDRAPAHPAMDRAARRPGVPGCAHLCPAVAPDRPDLVPGLPRGDRVLPGVRHRVGPDPGDTDDELEALAAWCDLHKRFRPLLHTGRAVRLDTVDPAVIAHGVVAADQDSAILCHVQLDESQHNRGCTLRVQGLRPDAAYRLEWLGPVDLDSPSMSPRLAAAGPTDGAVVTGRQLADLGFWLPRRPPESAQLIHVTRA